MTRMCAPALLLGLVLPAAGEQTDPREILHQAAAAAKALKALSYQAQSYAEGFLRQQVPKLSGRLRARRAPGRVPSFVLEAQGSKPATGQRIVRQYVCDGKRLLSIDRERQLALEGDAPQKPAGLARQLGIAAGLWLGQLWLPEPFRDALRDDSLRYEGRESVGGRVCRVVSAGVPGAAGRTRWFLDEQDHLPRRVERVEQSGTRVLVISALNTAPELAPGTFSRKVPADCKLSYVGLLPVGLPAPDWTLRTAAGKPVALQELRGRVVVMDFWATWCVPCKRAMPGLQRVHERFRGQPVAVYGITLRERGDPAGYMRRQGYTYGLLLEGEAVARAYNVTGIPALYVIGRDGRIVYRAQGYDPQGAARLAEAIAAALKAGG